MFLSKGKKAHICLPVNFSPWPLLPGAFEFDRKPEKQTKQNKQTNKTNHKKEEKNPKGIPNKSDWYGGFKDTLLLWDLWENSDCVRGKEISNALPEEKANRAQPLPILFGSLELANQLLLLCP